MKKLISIIFLFYLVLITPVLATELPEIGTQDVTIEFQGTKQDEIAYNETFKVVNKEQFVVWLKDYDETDKNQYSYPDYVCRDFSNDLRDNFYNDYGFYGVHTIWSRYGTGAHGINTILINDEVYKSESWLIIEPQNDDYWNATSAPYSYPLKIRLWYQGSGREYPFICGYIISPDGPVLFFTHSVDIEDWIERSRPSTFADWLYNNLILCARSVKSH